MSSLTRPSSPPRQLHNVTPNEEDHLYAALHAALANIGLGSPSHPHSTDHDMGKDRERSGIDILVDSSCVILRGAGAEIQPAILSGQVVLNLAESTSIKEITLQFRGKAKLPGSFSEQRALNNSSQMYNICSHEWSFLEGEKRNSHTLKAGRHLFPFQLQLGGSLLSSMEITAHGGLSVSYKLRAVAVRPGLASNMQAIIPVYLIRAFSPEAFEYHQTLEIENTWPGKLTYSIVVPHKAWAIGDELTVVFKFSPLAKGVRVTKVITTLKETTQFHCRGSMQEHTRTITTDIDVPYRTSREVMQQHSAIFLPAVDGTDSFPPANGVFSEYHTSSPGLQVEEHDIPVLNGRTISSSAPEARASTPLPAATSSAEDFPASTDAEEVHTSDDDIEMRCSSVVPRSTTPSHSSNPIIVSHRLHWSIFISNLDGHTSELRCSLPVYILDHRLIDEAQANSASIRCMVLGGSERLREQQQSTELPSYAAHVFDPIPNMHPPEIAQMRTTNATQREDARTPPLSSSLGISHVSQNAVSETHTPLSPAQSPTASLPVSGSRLVSRRGSRAPSPERHFAITAISASAGPNTGGGNGPGRTTSTTPHETYVHSNQATRSLPEISSVTMKPVTLSWRPRSSSHTTNLVSSAATASAPGLSSLSGQPTQPLLQIYTPRAVQAPSVTPESASDEGAAPVTQPAQWLLALTEVPTYGASTAGTVGIVPPLTSMYGLPSYEEAERSAVHGSGEVESHP